MIRGLFVLLLLATIAAVLGFTGLAGGASFIAKFFSFAFVGAAIIYSIGVAATREG
jgi:uncharacterized membrane protein YtjA (UPF0391 family)